MNDSGPDMTIDRIAPRRTPNEKYIERIVRACTKHDNQMGARSERLVGAGVLRIGHPVAAEPMASPAEVAVRPAGIRSNSFAPSISSARPS